MLENGRQICLASTTFKWFDTYLWASLVQRRRPLPSWILGFRSGKQATDLVGCLQRPLARAAEWGQPLLVAPMDVQGAFDAMLPDNVGEQPHSRGATR